MVDTTLEGKINTVDCDTTDTMDVAFTTKDGRVISVYFAEYKEIARTYLHHRLVHLPSEKEGLKAKIKIKGKFNENKTNYEGIGAVKLLE